MKAPFSKRAKIIFRDDRGSREYNRLVTAISEHKAPIDGKVQLANGKVVRVYSSSTSKREGFRK